MKVLICGIEHLKFSARRLMPSLLGCILGGCTQMVAITENRPRLIPQGDSTPLLARAARSIESVTRHKNKSRSLNHSEVLGELANAARIAWEEVRRDPDDPHAAGVYNFATARFIEAMHQGKVEPWRQAVRLPTPDGELLLTWKPDPRPQWNPALYDFLPADKFSVRGSYITKRIEKAGLGAPLVAIGREPNVDYREDFGLPRTYYGVTGFIEFDGMNARLSFLDPLNQETVRVGRATHSLAADFTVPLAVMLESAHPEKMAVPRLLRPEKYTETALIARLQPYDPNKTVVLVVHGLMSSPATWTAMINELRSDQAIRENFQFWFFSYPSGYPYPYAAALLRDELDAIQKKFPLRKPMVVMGHSMGGCISRLLVTDSGQQLWNKLIGLPPEETNFSPSTQEILKKSLIFEARPDVGRVIFISAPLRGADMAKSLPGRVGSMLVQTPRILRTVGQEVLQIVRFGSDDLKVKRLPNSIDTLAPNNRFVRAIDTLPIESHVPLHVIAGDRGKGGNRNQTKPVVSDGVVPFWSAYLPRAKSELIVDSDHGAHLHPGAIREVTRILNEHAGGPLAAHSRISSTLPKK
jgi:pimeloyl-ACP methyl ester carboxylesterase